MSDRSMESSAEERLISAMHIVGVLLLLLTAGCAGVQRTPPPTGAPAVETVAVEPSATHPTEESVAKAEGPDAKPPAKVPASRVAAEQIRKKQSATPSPEKKEISPPLDLTALQTRLKETKAIGVFTKITLKNQANDLLNQFRAYYQGRIKTTLAQLRQAYDMLLLKVLALLQDGDPELAHAIVTSRESIWGILADPAKFATLQT